MEIPTLDLSEWLMVNAVNISHKFSPAKLCGMILRTIPANYPNYEQQSPSNGGETGIVGDFQVDNQWVVTYCPYLFLKFDAHTNTEASVSQNSSKYIFMYFN